ncbi:membrane-spanning 4-domains subfamily A member 15-like [Genypterus blacodes]|uniref:membrane-spanning 4-domains subfamily A member 15-like n=1 Tax=Genypterus blacodes TaxID=154954 RepID=UPI003F76A552
MLLAVGKDKMVRLITVAPYDKNILPPLCRLLWELCCRPGCCSALPSATAALGTIQILVGVFNIGLGPGRVRQHPGDLTALGAAYWLGTVYIIAGILCLVAGQYPKRCLMGITVFLNISAAIFAITGIVLYAIDLREASFLWMCDTNSYSYLTAYEDSCRYVAGIAQSLLTSMDVTMIVLAVLQLCVTVSAAVLGIRALLGMMNKGENIEAPLLKEVKMTSPGA